MLWTGESLVFIGFDENKFFMFESRDTDRFRHAHLSMIFLFTFLANDGNPSLLRQYTPNIDKLQIDILLWWWNVTTSQLLIYTQIIILLLAKACSLKSFSFDLVTIFFALPLSISLQFSRVSRSLHERSSLFVMLGKISVGSVRHVDDYYIFFITTRAWKNIWNTRMHVILLRIYWIGCTLNLSKRRNVTHTTV